jgi:hypothetical protein
MTPQAEVRETGGATVHIDASQTEIGSEGPFERVFVDAALTTPWGYHCTVCDSLAVAADTMGRLECTECGNLRRPDEWDAAHE